MTLSRKNQGIHISVKIVGLICILWIIGTLLAQNQVTTRKNPSSMTMIYQRSQLLHLGSLLKKATVSGSVWSRINQLEICKPFRGTKAGKRKQRPIEMWVTNRLTGNNNTALFQNVNKQAAVNKHNLVDISLKKSLDVKMCLLNAQSVRNKAALLMDYIIEEDLDMMAITETWLRPGSLDNITVGEITPCGYSMLHKPRETGRGGGVGIIFRDNINVNMESMNCSYQTFECMQVTAVIRSFTYSIAIIYRPPPSVKNKLKSTVFFEEFDSFLSDHVLAAGKLVLMGDINLHMEDANNPDACKFHDLLEGYGLNLAVNEPTHRNNHLLDVLITRMDESPVHQVEISDPLISDHKIVSFALHTQRPPLPIRTITYRPLRKINISEFKDDIRRSNLSSLQSTNIVELVKVYNDTMSSILDKHAPEKTKIVTIRPVVEWYTQDIDKCRKEKRKWERKWQRSKLTVHRELYCQARDTLVSKIKQAKSNFFQNKISESSDQQKTLFSCLDKLLNKSNVSCLPEEKDSQKLANDIADYFTGKVTKIWDELLATDHSDFTPPPNDIPTLSYLPPISQENLKKVIMSSPTKSCALDPLPTFLLKECIDELIPSLCQIINVSMSTCVVPENFKTAMVTPLIKKPSLDRNVLKNYRPVSNLPFLSKVLEKVVCKSVSDHKSMYNLEEPFQSAYRKNHSTETALVHVKDSILCALDRSDAFF